MTAVDISIVIPTKNGEPWIRQTLSAIFEQATSHVYEVVVIDSGSSDQTVRAVGEFPVRLEHIAPADFDHGGTRNLGARLSHGDIVCFLSQDATPASESWLENLVNPFERRQDIGAIYGRQIPRPTASPIMRFLHEHFYPPQSLERRSGSNNSFSFRSILFSNVNSAVRRATLTENPFAEDLLMSEDQEFAVRVLANGWTVVYEPGAAVWHSNDYDFPRFFRRNFDSAYSLRRIYKDSPGRLKEGLGYLLGELIYLARNRYWSHIPTAIIWETGRAVAFLAGSNAESLPLSVRRKMSMRPEFWTQTQRFTQVR